MVNLGIVFPKQSFEDAFGPNGRRRRRRRREADTWHYVLLDIPPSKVMKLLRALDRKSMKGFAFP